MKFKSILIISLLLSILLLGFWFNDGRLIAYAEEGGIIFYNPSRTLEVFKDGWWKAGAGNAYIILIPRLLFLFMLSWFFKLGISGLALQVTTYWILLFTGIFSMYLLSKEVLDFQKKWWIPLTVSLFYLFNLYTQSQIWQRGVYLGFFVWAYLPLFLYSAISFLRKSETKYLILFLLSNILFSTTYGQPVYILTLWTPLLLFFGLEIWQRKNKRKKLKGLVVRFTGILIGWFFVNLWWLYPVFLKGSSSFGEYIDWKSNFDSLRGVSKYFSTKEILLLKQSYLFGENGRFYTFYNNPVIKGISWLILIVSIIGAYIGRHKKYWGFFIITAVVGWFISKGTNFPLGYQFYKFSFSNLPSLGALRNPYEKFGLVWLLPYSFFFGYGVAWLVEKYKKTKIVLFLFFFLSLGLLVWPTWTGDIFPAKAKLKIPSYYEELNEFLLKKEDKGKLFHLPYIKGDGVNYTWGFSGREPSEFLLDKYSVSKKLRFKPFDNVYDILPNYFENKSFSKLLGMMGVKYIVLHKDIEGKSYEVAREKLEKWDSVDHEKSFGELELYAINASQVLPEVRGYVNFVKTSDLNNGLTQVLSGDIDLSKELIVFTKDLNSDVELAEDLPEISVVRVSKTNYKVEVKNSKGPFLLLLNQTFDKLWKAEIDGVSIEDQFVINGFANGWLVKKEGNYIIKIDYKVYPWEDISQL